MRATGNIIDYKELLPLITEDVIIDIMSDNGSPVYGEGETGEGQRYLIFQTICHGGHSHKLYYYVETKTFHCYTNCGTMSVFDFVKKAQVINSPRAIRDFNEKLHSVYFKDLMSNNVVTASLKDIEDFLAVNKEIVIKPLNRCFGSGVMYLYEGDPNTRTIINTMTNNETTLVMVQQFIPGVKKGDKRVLTLGDKVLPYCVKKLPTGDDFKFNTHNDNFVVKAEISQNEINAFTPVAKKLNSMGISMAGLDVIDGKIIEVNVTSPCYFIKEINNIYNIHLEDEICDFLLTESLLSL